MLRKARGLTQQELAKLVGTTNQQIGHLERGKRRLTEAWMRRIAEALGVSPFELLSEATPALDEQERAMLSLYRSLSKAQRDAFYQAFAALAKPLGEDDAPGGRRLPPNDKQSV